ncbi:hypothetical protein CMUS01_08831 [Colletotrichum musicola]|uniref:Uncharacterized protein n=1 Tax=Colletotrichum musicola TaxID=2175873 RepID=A0A8H6NC27_9PEZI|nr:hypothetical protein CMUS01_08831 [Colletotrichum musicola]
MAELVDDAISPDSDAMADFAQIPAGSSDDKSTLRCCCGRNDCVFLKHSCTVLETVEKDVHTAAKLGKALLARHEAYMADAERDRLALTRRIEELETDKLELQAENARTVAENRTLLDQLEMLNNTVQDSDIRIQTLEATLLSSHQAVRRLEGAAARAAEMERHIALLEQEQLRLQNTLITTESEARSAMQRWRKAERGISDLQEQLERMEQEAKEERDRHAEVLGRMERQRDMEKELNAAAGRLKGAAATKSLRDGKNANVVSHFVRDLLQDNANLQLGMAELREMLVSSNDEIQALRDQLMCHQPVGDEDVTAASTLRAELAPRPAELPKRFSQELHIHHHYHVAEKAKSKKKRHSLNPGAFSPTSIISGSPTPPAVWRPPPTPPTLASHSHKASTSTVSMGPSNRWSIFSEQPSEFAPSSVPSSPQSNPRLSMFDKPMLETELPSSPTTSLDPTSPTWKASQQKRTWGASGRSFSVPSKILSVASPAPPAAPALHISKHLSTTIEEEREEDDTHWTPNEEYAEAATETGMMMEVSYAKDDELPRKRLHRAVSHESIMSLSGGLDIHTLKVRPSQLTLRPLGGADAVFTGVTVRPTISRGSDKRSDALLRDSLAGMPMPRIVSTPARSASPASTFSQQSQYSGGLGRWVSWRPWSGTSSVSRSTTPTPTPTKRGGGGKDRDKDGDRDLLRAPGINQPGAIPGFQEYLAAHQRRGAPSKVSPDLVDIDALREGLEG